MIELRGIETRSADDASAGEPAQYRIISNEAAELKPGDEFLLLVGEPDHPRRERYGLPLRITEREAPEEDDVIVEHNGKSLVAQKVPEFI